MPPLPVKKVVPSPKSQGTPVKPSPVFEAPEGFEVKLVHVITFDPTVRGNTNTVKAKCIGNLAVHKSLLKEGEWSISHTIIQLSLVSLSSEADAIKVARYLWTNLPNAFSQTTIQKVVEKSPKWLAPWCKQMREEKKWLDPKPFQSKEK